MQIKGNPIDILDDASVERYIKAVEICLTAKEIDGLLVMLIPQMMIHPAEAAGGLIPLLQQAPYPVFTAWLGGPDVEEGRDMFNRAGIPTFDSPERAVRAFMDLYQYSVNLEILQQIPPKLPQRLACAGEETKRIIREALVQKERFLSEVTTKMVLAAYGIPVNRTEVALSEKEAVEKAHLLGFPIVMKIISPDIMHKADAKFVLLGLKDEQEIYRAYEQIMQNAFAFNPQAQIEGVTLQRMLDPPDYELMIEVKRDPDFGPVILFGMGGILTEVIKDRAITLPPLNRLLAKRLMEETKIYRLLQGCQHRPPANGLLLEEILIRVAQLVTDFSEIAELDINPLVVTGKGICALDAKIVLIPSPLPAPFHLVISPYPNQYETRTQSKDGIPLFIRPIRPEDAPLLVEMFNMLSPRSVFFRFFSPLKTLPHSMLARFTQIDYDREIALVALEETNNKEKMLGVARVIRLYGRNTAEVDVAVADSWQGKGIGAELLLRCLTIAKEQGIEEVFGTILSENTQMLELARKLGFHLERIPSTNEYLINVDLRKPLHVPT